MSFTFNFLSETNAETTASGLTSSPRKDHNHHKTASLFEWFQDERVDESVENVLRNFADIFDHSEVIRISAQEIPTDTTTRDVIPLSYIRRIREDAPSVVGSSSSSQYKNTDLVPGIYEGGLKVWECSIDLCKYLHQHHIDFNGFVLEIGSGHGLPACWVLKQAIAKEKPNCSVVLSDYNEFVLRDVTIPNVVLNGHDSFHSEAACMAFWQNKDKLMQWLRDHVAFGAGDWNLMSSLLMTHQQQSNSPSHPAAVPPSGLFDFILAAETTYSETAAIETANIIARHLKPATGTAYIATKRYYFGVGGGTSCFCEALKRQTEHRFDIEILQVYDNGVSNIRELLLVRCRS